MDIFTINGAYYQLLIHDIDESKEHELYAHFYDKVEDTDIFIYYNGEFTITNRKSNISKLLLEDDIDCLLATEKLADNDRFHCEMTTNLKGKNVD